MSGHDELIIELQECVDELTKKIEELIDERSFLRAQLKIRNKRHLGPIKSADEHLQEDWLNGL